jgi:hypothetical protein
MLSRAQWYREQANLACNEVMKRIVREWLRLAEQAEWIANQRKRPPTKKTRAGIELGVESPSTVPLSTAGTSSHKRALRNARYVQKA